MGGGVAPRQGDTVGAGTVIRVTTTEDFYIEGHEPNLEHILKEWFEDPRYPMDFRHAYRDRCKIGNSRKVLSYEIVRSVLEGS